MTKLIVHIGHGKTGSSSIQRTLLDGRRTLLDAGCAYLGLMLEHGRNAGRKPWQKKAGSDAFFSEGRQPAEANDELFEVLAGTLEALDRDGIGRAIWSNEWLAQRAAYALPALQRLARAGHEIEVQCYVRRHDSWMLSAYSQWGIRRKAQDGPVVPFRAWRKAQGGDRLTFWDDLAPWHDAFGAAFRIFNFDSIADVVGHFLTTNGLPELPARTENASPSPVSMAAQALFNSLQETAVKPDAFRRVSRLIDAQEEVCLPPLDELFPGPDELSAVVAQSREDIDRINDLLARQGQPPLDFSEPPAIVKHPTPWQVDQYVLRLIFALNDEVQKLKGDAGAGLVPARKPDDAPAAAGPAEDELPRLRAEIALLRRRLAAAEQQHEAAAMQLRKLTQPHLREVRDRLRLAVALDAPDTLYSADAVAAEVQRLRREAAEATRRMQQREAELMSSTSWRVTAPLRAISRLVRRH